MAEVKYPIAGICLALGLGCASGPKPMPQAGAAQARLAPGAELVRADHPMRNVDGEMVRIADVRGAKGTLVVVTCNHCPWSKAWEARITELGNRFSAEGVGVIALNPNDPEAYPEDAFVEMQDRAAEAQMKFPYVVDEGGVVTKAFGATKTPEVFLFDAADKLVYVGAVDDNANDPGAVGQRYLQNALEALVAGRQVPVPETRALGCSIKVDG